MLVYGRKLLIVYTHLGKFASHKHYVSEYVMILV